MLKLMQIIAFLTSFCTCLCYCHATEKIVFNLKSAGRLFDGIGGLSGGGATSKLLVNYAEPYRSQILDYLFKPNFGASLHMLKVEIGGDSQSTEGTEASHMHNPWDENYNRGYEWWLMKEAKKRNPSILLYALPWAFPGWVAMGTRDPYHEPNVTAGYVVKWIQGAKRVHGLDIDYVGIWNEKPYTVAYILCLRDLLDAAGFSKVKIIAADGGWGIAKDVLKVQGLAHSLYGIGAHYPGTITSLESLQTGKPLWSSEDYSTLNNDVGAGCWARILNQNYVNGFMTSTIAWNLIASYYDALPYTRCSLMTANEPWSGHYELTGPLWVTAHTTQFTRPGWSYLAHGEGVGPLVKGGSYVSLVSPKRDQVTVIIETMSHDHSLCIRPALAPYTVETQNVSISFKGLALTSNKLNIWKTTLGFNGTKSEFFKFYKSITIPNSGEVNIALDPDTLITMTTMEGVRGSYPASPPSAVFPLPYSDNFEGYGVGNEPFYISPQVGSFEVVQHSGQHVLIQTVLQQPVDWCGEGNNKSIALLGDYKWSDTRVQCDVYVPSVNATSAVFIASWVDQGGCTAFNAKGIYFWIFPENGQFEISANLERTQKLSKGSLTVTFDKWYTLAIETKNGTAKFFIGNEMVDSISSIPLKQKFGFTGLGTENFGHAYYDNLLIKAN